jgi:hypothetical protein
MVECATDLAGRPRRLAQHVENFPPHWIGKRFPCRIQM